MKTRKSRKNEHIYFARKIKQQQLNGFDQFKLVNNSLPELNYNEIDLTLNFLGKKVDYPIMINAMTGGTKKGYRINKSLANLAKKFNIPMAVGSQRIALRDTNNIDSFKVVRQINPNGIVIANIGANSSIEEMKSVINMIEADAVQLHVNVAQEICMQEGDRNFIGILDNIEHACKEINVPVIIKETGCGISKQVALQLYDRGVRYIDIGGFGGTNFVKIENMRNKYNSKTNQYLENWGIPTAVSLAECREVNKDIVLICSGGMKDAYDIVKAIRLGANMTALCGSILNCNRFHFEYEATKYLECLTEQIKKLMLLTGAKCIENLKTISMYQKSDRLMYFMD